MDMASYLSGFVRATQRAKNYWSVGADVRSAIILALFSNHRTSRLAVVLNRGKGLKTRASGLSAVQLDLNSSDHRTIFREIYLDQVYNLAAIPFRPQVILDCGAHIGLFSRLAAAAYPETPVYAFEPNAKNFRWLEMQCAFPNAKITPIQAAVDLHEGTGILVGEGCHGAIQPGTCSCGGEEVRLVDLSAWLNNLPTVQALVLKVDIEGKEFDVLPHVLPVLPLRTAILFETHSFRGDSNQLVRNLEANGFSVQQVRSRTEGETTFSDFMAIRTDKPNSAACVDG
jgi:FkbM family methyltransferase